jgi:membrane associated rhomboid family serine protease
MNPVLVGLIASVVVVSVVAWSNRALRNAFVLHPASVKGRKQVYRLLTAGWVHADPGHLFFNMLTLYFFADGVMRILGVARFMLLYMSGVVVAYIPTTLRFRNNANYSSLGASGGVAAVLFSAIALIPGLRVGIPIGNVFMPGYLYGLGYLAYSAYQAWRAKDGVNHDAHFTGAIYGALLTYVFEPARVENTLRHLF